MKNLKTIFSLSVLALLLVFSSCGPIDIPISYDETLLYGQWIEGTVHDTYLEDGTGYSWDTSEDITEEEASPFEWSLNNDQLQILHTLWNGTVVPKVYTITTLNSYKLVYKDDYGTVHTFVRFGPDPGTDPDPEPDPDSEEPEP